MNRVAILIASLALLTACRSEDDQIRDVINNYLEADIVHAAPHRAYIYLSSSDKKHTPIETYAAERAETVARSDASFTIDTIEHTADRANVTVTISEGPVSEEIETVFVVIEELNGKHRVYLGLKEIADIREKLDKARRLSEDGAVEKARELIEQVNSSPFRGSRPDRYEREIASSKATVERRESRKSLDKRMGEALKMNIPELKQEVDAIEKLVPEDDEVMKAALEKLKAQLETRIKKAALENFVFSDQRVRRVPDGWGGIVRTVTFKARNNTGRPLSALKIEVRFVNEAGGEALGQAEFELIAEGKVLDKQAALPFEKQIKKIPAEWKSKEIEIIGLDLEFADKK